MKQTNERLCALAQKGDAAALDSLIDNNKSFIGKVANDLFRSMNLAQSGLNLDTDDLKHHTTKSGKPTPSNSLCQHTKSFGKKTFL